MQQKHVEMAVQAICDRYGKTGAMGIRIFMEETMGMIASIELVEAMERKTSGSSSPQPQTQPQSGCSPQ